MAHELTPKAGQPYLPPEEVLQRLRMAFKYVDASSSRAAVSIEVVVADQSEPGLAYLTVLIEPNEKPFFGYESGSHEDAARPLLERIAEVLDYELELV